MIESLVERGRKIASNFAEARRRGIRKNMEVSDWQFTFREAFEEGGIFPQGWLQGDYGPRTRDKQHSKSGG